MSIDADFQYTGLIWSGAFLVLWGAVFFTQARLRRRMLWASVLTMPFGLTEPLFVPAYWNPPSLFDLAQRTGFDLESLIFCFAIGGLGAVGYRILVPASDRHLDHSAHLVARHRWHRAALASLFVVFAVLLPLPWNPIYAGIGALLTGALASLLCRPDLWRGSLIGGVFFFDALYGVPVWVEVAMTRLHRSCMEFAEPIAMAARWPGAGRVNVRLWFWYVLERCLRACCMDPAGFIWRSIHTQSTNCVVAASRLS